jgi:hypothetical protein
MILIYGLPEGETREYMETILYAKAESMAEAERVKTILERDYGCTRCRIWTYNGEAPDFTKVLS